MHRYTSQRGAALIMMMGIMATLAILAATMVFVISNQQKATANERSRTQSVYAAEAAIDSGVQLAKVASPMPTASPPSGSEWLTPSVLAAAFTSEFPGAQQVTYDYYDNLSTVVKATKWDSNRDKLMWVEATVKYADKTTKERVLISQSIQPFAAALPKAVTYSDTGIMLKGTSDIYAVQNDGSAWPSSTQAQTAISAGGTWLPTTPSGDAEVGRLTTNATADLRGPGSSYQSIGIKVNGSVSMNGTVKNAATPPPTGSISSGGRTFTNVTILPGSVGFLSDYFDQASQASLANEAQEGGTHAAAPTLPVGWSSTGYTAIAGTITPAYTGVLGTLMDPSLTATYTATSDLVMPSTLNSGNLTLSRGTSTTGRAFNFQDLYVAGNLTLTGPVTVNCTSLYVGGTLTITNSTSGSPTVTDSFGPLYVAGTGASSVRGKINLTTSSIYTGGSLTIENTTSSALSDSLGPVYVGGDFSASGPVTLNSTASTSSPPYLYAGGGATITGPSSGTITDQFGLIYTAGTTKTLTFSGNVQVKATSVVANGDFTISGATTAIKDWLGAIFVAAFSSSSNPSLNHGDIIWSENASVTSRDWTQQTIPTAEVAQPKPMWMGRKWSRTGTYSDEYGNVWVPGNSSTSIDFDASGTSTIMCPLLSTTEKPTFTGNITFGSRAQPMVFFYMCDNNGIYPMVCQFGVPANDTWGHAQAAYTGTFYGLMVINESTIDFIDSSNNTLPTVEGAVFAGCPYDPTHTSGMSKSDIVLEGASCIAFNEAVVGAIATSSLKTTTMVTQTVPGSWQQLPLN